MLHPDTGEPLTYKRTYVAIRNNDEIDGRSCDGVSIKLHDKMRALERLEKYLDYMTEEDGLRLAKLQAEVKAADMKGRVLING